MYIEELLGPRQLQYPISGKTHTQEHEEIHKNTEVDKLV